MLGCVCVCVCFLLVSERIPKSHHSPETSNNNKARTHTHVYYTITVARFLAIDDHHGGVFFQKSKKKNSRQRKTTTNTVSPLSLYLIHVVFFLILLSFVSIDEYLLPRRCQLSFPFFLSSLFLVRLKSTEQSITSHTSCPLWLAKKLFFIWSAAETSGRS